ncbi:MAG: hypothetical protein HY716_05305 [Planctomycetes bacterium]|nr:hypothetical protein [Planctomycetota bacterium]
MGSENFSRERSIEVGGRARPLFKTNFDMDGGSGKPTPDPELERIATALRDTFQVGFVAPGHCTGEPAFGVFARAFGDRYLYAGLGHTIAVPASRP